MKVKMGKFPKYAPQKIDVRIDDFDVWNLDSTLAQIILPALLHLKSVKHGVPNEFANVGGEDFDYQKSFDFYMDSHDWAFSEGLKEWDNVLDKMIWAFEQIVINTVDKKYAHGKPNYKFKKSDYKFLNPITNQVEDTFNIVNENEDYWFDHEGQQLHMNRIQEGLDLFAKYYRSLWD